MSTQNQTRKVQTRICPVCNTVHDLPLCERRSEERSTSLDLSEFSDRELKDLLRDSTHRDQHDAIEIELENRDRATRGLEPL